MVYCFNVFDDISNAAAILGCMEVKEKPTSAVFVGEVSVPPHAQSG